jgi:hypothetical protein
LGNPFLAFMATLGEGLLTILLLRFLFRVVYWACGVSSPVEHPVERAARVAEFKVPEGYDPRPKPWQRGRGARGIVESQRRDVYAPRPTAAE